MLGQNEEKNKELATGLPLIECEAVFNRSRQVVPVHWLTVRVLQEM